MSKKKLTPIGTPSGVASYPWLTKEDPTYGGYKVNLKLEAEEAAPVMAAIDKSMKEAWELVPDGKKPKENIPYNIEEDGSVTVKFKSNFAPIIVDAQTRRIPKDVNVFGGSIIKVNGELNPYYVSTTGVGVSIWIQGVQVIELSEGNGSHGFEKTEGYTAETPQSPIQNKESSDDDEDF